jgi:hypothetical protein
VSVQTLPKEGEVTFFARPPQPGKLSVEELASLLQNHTVGIDQIMNSVVQPKKSDMLVFILVSMLHFVFSVVSFSFSSVFSLGVLPQIVGIGICLSAISTIAIVSLKVLKRRQEILQSVSDSLIDQNIYYYCNAIKPLIDEAITRHQHYAMPDAQKYLLGLRLAEAELALKRAQTYIAATK